VIDLMRAQSGSTELDLLFSRKAQQLFISRAVYELANLAAAPVTRFVTSCAPGEVRLDDTDV
jgi:hypothetical protein